VLPKRSPAIQRFLIAALSGAAIVASSGDAAQARLFGWRCRPQRLIRWATCPCPTKAKCKADSYAVLCDRGDAAISRKKYDEAIDDFTLAIKLRPEATRAYSGRGQALIATNSHEKALPDLDRAIQLEPQSSIHHMWRAHAYFALDERGNKWVDELWEAIHLNPGDVGVNYEPTSSKQLPAEALAHGEEQVRRMLHDRPEMAERVTEGDELWTWAARKFAGEDSGELIDWNPANPPGRFGAQSDPGDDYKHPAIRVRGAEDGKKSDEQPTLERLWAYAVVELYNQASRTEFDHIDQLASDGKIRRDDYVVATLDVEEQSAQRTRAFYLKVFLPWARARKLATEPGNWYCDFWKNRQQYIAFMRTDPHWDFYSVGYDLTCVDQAYRLGQYGRAEAILNRLLSRQSTLVQDELASVRYWLGYVRWGQGDLQKAAAEFATAVAADPTLADAYLTRGELLVYLGSYDQAIEPLTKFIDQFPARGPSDQADAHCNRGTCYVRVGKNDEALSDFEEVLRTEPERIEAIGGRGNAYYAKRQLDEALADYSQLIHLLPDDANGYVARGRVLIDKQEYTRATTDFSDAIRLDPKMASAYAYRGNLWVRRREYERARGDLRKAAQLAPSDIGCQNNLAWFLATCPDARYRNGREAVRPATAACSLSQWKNPLTLDTLACALAEAGNFQEAIKRSHQALQAAKELDEGTTKQIQAHLTQFEHRQPYHDPPPE
jgi:tetratricopeptide (TPR) repeat protein